MNKYNVTTEEGVVLVMNLDERIKYECDLISNMSEEEACKQFNVDSKEEAIQATIEYFTFIH